MLKNKEIRSHLILTGVYCLALLPFVVFQWRLSMLFFLVGAFLGTFILDLDHLVYAFYQNPEEESSQRIREAFKRRDWKGLVQVLEECHQEHTELVFHQAVF